MKRSIAAIGFALFAAVLCGGVGSCLRPQAGAESVRRGPAKPEHIRGVWVTRFDYRSEGDIVRIMRNCKSIGLNTVLFQVRGAGTAYYRSRIEPWDEKFGGRDPGFDPLAVACREARRNGLSLHAWVNVMPAWRGTKPPRDGRQLYNAHPDWFWYDQSGKRQPLTSFYVSLNPCLPEVRDYLTAVCHDIVSRYDLDGLHLDYIRFPNEPPASTGQTDYPRDRRTAELFQRDTGQSPDGAPQVWNQWRSDQVTNLVRQIRTMVRKVRPDVALSAAVGPEPAVHYSAHFQDSLRWIREGLLDFVAPMNYTYDPSLFLERNRAFLDAGRRIAVAPGVVLQLEGRPLSDDALRRHLEAEIGGAMRQCGHVCLFAYGYLFPRPGESPDPQQALRRKVVAQIMSHYAGPASRVFAAR